MKIVIAGGGRVGSALAARLRDKHSVTIVDKDAEVCERLFEELGVVTVHGNATDPRILERAQIGTADIAAGVLPEDAENLAFATVVRSLSSARLMVRMLDDAYRTAYRIAGVRELIAEAEIVVTRMTAAVEFPRVEGIMPLAGSDLVVFEIRVDSRALVAGKAIAAIRADPAFPHDSVFIGIADPSGRVQVPTGDSILNAGHLAILVAGRTHIGKAVECLTTRPAVGETAVGLSPSLRRIEFFAPLSEDELLDLASAVVLVRKQSGDLVFRKGDAGDTFFLVLAGEISIGDGTTEFERVRPGGFFGEVSLLTGETRGATAVAGTDCELAAIGRADFRRVVMSNPTLALEMSRLLGERLASAAKRTDPAKRGGIFRRT